MIEQVMIFVLGACVAGLLALLCLPAVSRRAFRIAQTTVERQMPISVDEIVAQRDLLRAEFAVDRRRIEQALERAKNAHAHEMSEAGRRAAEIGRMKVELAAMTGARDATAAERDAAQSLQRETGAENAALQVALYDADAGEAQWRDRHAALAHELQAMISADAEKAQLVADLRRDQDERMAAGAVLERELMQAKLDISISRAREETMAAQIDGHEDATRDARAREGELRRKLADAEHSREQTGDIDMLRRTIVEIGREVVRMADVPPVPSIERSETREPASFN